MTLEEFCNQGLLEEYSRIGNDDGDMRIDVDFSKDDFSYQISFIANIFEIDYDDLLDDFEKYELEEFDSPVYFINVGSFEWSNHWEELLNDYYFSFESLMDAIRSKLELFVTDCKNEALEYDGIRISNCTSQDSDAVEADLDSFVESLLK